MPTSHPSSAEHNARRATVVGYGSIGRRHARILEELGCIVSVVSRHATDHPRVCSTVAEACARHAPDYVVIANETAAHLESVRDLDRAGFSGRVLVEKPLFHRLDSAPLERFASVAVAYNLRFHPGLSKLRSLLKGEEAVTASVYVGQYLPSWRPGSDWRASYSAHSGRGGGVLRDLSHDLDYTCWLLGEWRRIAALGGHLSALEVESDDAFALIMETSACRLVTIQMSYLDRAARRQIIINTQSRTYHLDMVANTLTVDQEQEQLILDRDSTYREMHRAILEGRVGQVCTASEALGTMHLIESAERAAESQEWVTR